MSLVITVQPAAAQQTYTVDTGSNNAALNTCSAAPNDCSLAGALGLANSDPDTDTILFDVPGVNQNGVNLPTITQPIRIYGGFNVSECVALSDPPTGAETVNLVANGATGDGFRIASGVNDVDIFGMNIVGFGGQGIDADGGSHRFGCNVINGDNTGNSGIFLRGSDNRVELNRIIRHTSLGVRGFTGADNNIIWNNIIVDNDSDGVRIDGDTNQIGQTNATGSTSDNGNIINRNGGFGVRVLNNDGGGSDDNRIGNNAINDNDLGGIRNFGQGTVVGGNTINVNGTTPANTAADGINSGGGSTPSPGRGLIANGNTINGNGGLGIFHRERDAIITNNTINNNGREGIYLTYDGNANAEITTNTILSNGDNDEANRDDGVRIQGGAAPTRGVVILRNSIFGNGAASANGLGIDLLGPQGPNFPQGVDNETNRANQGLNFPQIDMARISPLELMVDFTLDGLIGNSANSELYIVEFFASPACDASGFGEGREYLGSRTVTYQPTTNKGPQSYSRVVNGSANGYTFITATVTELDDDAAGPPYPRIETSEFSQCFQAQENTAPDVSITLLDSEIGEGDATYVSIDITDDVDVAFPISIDWGDGLFTYDEIDTTALGFSFPISYGHQYADDDSEDPNVAGFSPVSGLSGAFYPVTIAVFDSEGALGIGDAGRVQVNNVDPRIIWNGYAPVWGQNGAVFTNGSFPVTIEFYDPGFNNSAFPVSEGFIVGIEGSPPIQVSPTFFNFFSCCFSPFGQFSGFTPDPNEDQPFSGYSPSDDGIPVPSPWQGPTRGEAELFVVFPDGTEPGIYDITIGITDDDGGMDNVIFPVTVDAIQESPFLVNTPQDNDDGYCTALNCSLREAIQAANWDGPITESSTIRFDPTVFGVGGDDIIDVGTNLLVGLNPLPPITAPVLLDGLTGIEAGDACPLPESPTIVVSGNALGAGEDGLFIDSDGVTVQGLQVVDFSQDGINSDGGTVDNPNVITCNELINNGRDGVRVDDDADSNQVTNNFMGSNGTTGIQLRSANHTVTENVVVENAIGIRAGNVSNDNVISNNEIALNTGLGIAVGNSAAAGAGAQGTTISQNSIYDNGGLGIDFGGDDDTATDGKNNDQEFPTNVEALLAGVSIQISGDVTAFADGETYTIEVFTVDVCNADTSGSADTPPNGEGETFLGSDTIDTTIDDTFAITVPLGGLGEGDIITLTATHDSNGSTSEFTECVTIIDPADISISDAEGTEGDPGDDNSLEFIVSLDVAASENITVDYMTTDVTATAGVDASTGDYNGAEYEPLSGTAFIAAGNVSVPITIGITEDLLIEGNETFAVTLTNVTGPAVLADPSGTGTIIDDDEVTLTSVANPMTAPELDPGDTPNTITFTVTQDTPVAMSVDYEFQPGGGSNGNANVNTDISVPGGPTGTLNFDGITPSADIVVEITPDLLEEGDEDFQMILSNPSVTTVLPVSSTVGTIIDDDYFITYRIYSANDAFEYIDPDVGSPTYYEESFQLGIGDNLIAGMRFCGLPFDQGMEINQAVVIFSPSENNVNQPFLVENGDDNFDELTNFLDDAVNVNLAFEDSDDADEITSGNPPSSRTPTTESTDWSIPAGAWGLPIPFSNDVTTSLQEVVDRGGWTNGSDLVLLVTDDSGDGVRLIYSGAASSGGSLEPWLVVEVNQDTPPLTPSPIDLPPLCDGAPASISITPLTLSSAQIESTEEATTEDGTTDDGATDDGTTDDGTTDDGATDDGATDDGTTDDGSAE